MKIQRELTYARSVIAARIQMRWKRKSIEFLSMSIQQVAMKDKSLENRAIFISYSAPF